MSPARPQNDLEEMPFTIHIPSTNFNVTAIARTGPIAVTVVWDVPNAVDRDGPIAIAWDGPKAYLEAVKAEAAVW